MRSIALQSEVVYLISFLDFDIAERCGVGAAVGRRKPRPLRVAWSGKTSGRTGQHIIETDPMDANGCAGPARVTGDSVAPLLVRESDGATPRGALFGIGQKHD